MKIAVVGASGYAGGELLRLLAGHPKFEISYIAAGSNAGELITNLHPQLTNFAGRKFESTNVEMINKCQLAFIALPHGESAKLISQIDKNVKIVDLGADFRLKDSGKWAKYYSGEHAGSWTYGLPEVENNVENISKSSKVANPGCYATAIALAFAPLIKHDLIDQKYMTVVAASGTTGAGKKPAQSLLASEVMGSLSNYKLNGTHQHIPEIEQALSQISGFELSLSFNPILAPMPRGILANCISLLKKPMTISEVSKLFSEYYKNQPFVQIQQGTSLQTSSVIDTNNCTLQISIDQKTNQITVVSVLDNLIKGASGQAIQNMNLMCGWDQTLGLVDQK